VFPGINPNAVSGSKRPGAPCRPIITSVVFTATSAAVTVSPPDHNGGAYIRSYIAVSNPGNLIGADSNPNNIIVSGLTPNTNYNFTAYAVNEISSGTVSIPSGTIKTLTDIPTAPTGIIAVATSSTKATVSYTQSSRNNGLTITSYTAVSTPGGITASTSTSASSTIYVTGLSIATGYTFQVYATNSKGNSPYSAASNSITTFAVVPNAPTIGTASSISGNQISVSYTPPAFNGGSAITSYTAISNPGGVTASAASGNIVFSTLSRLTSYTFTVYATNAVGNSAVSAASNSATIPAYAPGAPAISSVSLNTATSVTVAYTAPADNGGVAITSYTAVSTPGSISATVNTAASGNIVVTGLSTASSYYFYVYATNSVGVGANSSTSSYVATWGSITYATSGKSNLPNTYSWVAPWGVTSVSVVAVGAGGGGGYSNLGSARNSWFCNVNLVAGGGGGNGVVSAGFCRYRPGGVYCGAGGGFGGNGGIYRLSVFYFNEGAGGGAGGYTAAGGNGAAMSNCGASGRGGCAGGGGAGGGGNSYLSCCRDRRDGGGGVGLFGKGLTGAAGGNGGSGGGNSYGTSNQRYGGDYGGGGSAYCSSSGAGAGAGGGLGWKNNITVTPGQTYTVQAGAQGADSRCRGGAGAVRIVWPASSAAGNRAFPSTNVSTP